MKFMGEHLSPWEARIFVGLGTLAMLVLVGMLALPIVLLLAGT